MILGIRTFAGQALVVAALLTLGACGGGSPSGPSGGGGSSAVVRSTGAVGAVGATITIGTNQSVSPGQVTVAVGQSVTFVNNDTRAHDMESDPHPAHTACPSMGNVGLLPAGQSKTTFGFANTGTCGFHDHNNPDTGSLSGRIVVQ